MVKIVAGTGHRLKDCGHPESGVRSLVSNKLFGVPDIKVFITGMAPGFDLWAADEARKQGIEVWAARPWTNHDAGIKNEKLYQSILDYASKVVVVTESETYPGPWCMHKRNHWMVDNCTHVLAYLNPIKTTGGTFECVKYALSKSKPIARIYDKPPF